MSAVPGPVSSTLVARAPAAPGVAAGNSGFVLVIVLWWLVLLMAVTTQIASTARTAIQITGNIRGSAVAEAAADGAVNEAIFHVLAQRWAADGVPRLVRGLQTVAEVRVDDEGGKIDVNVVPRIIMQALLGLCGAAPAAADRLSTAIVEWRSPDILRAAGAERAPRYGAAGLGYVPPNRRFVSLDELGLVIGMTPGLLACIAPHVTVYALSVPSRLSTGDPVVQQALAAAYSDGAADLAAASLHDVSVIHITATAREASGGQYRRVAVVRVAPVEPDGGFTYKVLSWQGAAG